MRQCEANRKRAKLNRYDEIRPCRNALFSRARAVLHCDQVAWFLPERSTKRVPEKRAAVCGLVGPAPACGRRDRYRAARSNTERYRAVRNERAGAAERAEWSATPDALERRRERQALQEPEHADAVESASRDPRSWHRAASNTPIFSTSPLLRVNRADQATAVGLHRRFPDWLIDELVAPHLCRVASTARRCVPYRKPRAMRCGIGRCAWPLAAMRACAVGNGAFCFRNVSQ